MTARVHLDFTLGRDKDRTLGSLGFCVHSVAMARRRARGLASNLRKCVRDKHDEALMMSVRKPKALRVKSAGSHVKKN